MFLILEYSMPSQDYPYIIVADMSDNRKACVLSSVLPLSGYGMTVGSQGPKHCIFVG